MIQQIKEYFKMACVNLQINQKINRQFTSMRLEVRKFRRNLKFSRNLILRAQNTAVILYAIRVTYANTRLQPRTARDLPINFSVNFLIDSLITNLYDDKN